MASSGASLAAMVAPPKAAAVALTTVTPIWTVARNRSGALRSAATARAPPRRSSTSAASRGARTPTTAISAAAKKPLARTSSSRIPSSASMGRSYRAGVARRPGGARGALPTGL